MAVILLFHSPVPRRPKLAPFFLAAQALIDSVDPSRATEHGRPVLVVASGYFGRAAPSGWAGQFLRTLLNNNALNPVPWEVALIGLHTKSDDHEKSMLMTARELASPAVGLIELYHRRGYTAGFSNWHSKILMVCRQRGGKGSPHRLEPLGAIIGSTNLSPSALGVSTGNVESDVLIANDGFFLGRTRGIFDRIKELSFNPDQIRGVDELCGEGAAEMIALKPTVQSPWGSAITLASGRGIFTGTPSQAVISQLDDLLTSISADVQPWDPARSGSRGRYTDGGMEIVYTKPQPGIGL